MGYFGEPKATKPSGSWPKRSPRRRVEAVALLLLAVQPWEAPGKLQRGQQLLRVQKFHHGCGELEGSGSRKGMWLRGGSWLLQRPGSLQLLYKHLKAKYQHLKRKSVKLCIHNDTSVHMPWGMDAPRTKEIHDIGLHCCIGFLLHCLGIGLHAHYCWPFALAFGLKRTIGRVEETGWTGG